jgi:hypothetical protein
VFLPPNRGEPRAQTVAGISAYAQPMARSIEFDVERLIGQLNVLQKEPSH